MHYYKRNIGDYAKKAGRLSIMQHGTYTLLIDACYDREQFPTLEQAIEWVWASTTEEIEALKFVLSRFFVLENGVYSQKRIREEIDEYQEKAETNKRIALEREAKRRENSTNRAPVVNEPPPNHKPITKNQEPKKKEKPAPLCVAVSVLLEKGFDVLTAEEFIAHKNKIKAPLTARAWSDHLAESVKAGWTPKAAAEKVMAKNWKGFEAKYVANEAVISTYEPPYAKYMREKMEQISPSIAAKNPNSPVKKIDPNEFLRTIEAQNVIRIN